MGYRQQLLLSSTLLLAGSLFGCDGKDAPKTTAAPSFAVESLAPIAVAHAEPKSSAAPANKGTATVARFGAPLSSATAILAQTLIADPMKYDDKDVKITGQVSAACQKKGCWMTIGSGEPGKPTVRISFKDYGFFVPTDCMGKTAVVEGHFKVTSLSAAEAQHYANDAAKPGSPVQKVTAPQRTLSLVATGVELL